MRYVRYTAYVCMFGRRGKGAEIPLMGVRFFEIAIPLRAGLSAPVRGAVRAAGSVGNRTVRPHSW